MERKKKKGKSNVFVPQSSQVAWQERSQRREELGELFQQNQWMWGTLGVSWI